MKKKKKIKLELIKNNKWVKISVIVVVSLFLLGIIKDQMIRSAVTIGATQVTGAPTKIKSFRLGILTQSVQIKDFRMYNPKGFPKGVLVDIPEIRVDYNLLALFTGKLHFRLIVLNLNELIVIKNKEGVLNVDALKVLQKSEKPDEKAEEKKKAKPSKPLKMKIDVLKLNAGRVVLKDYSKGEHPIVRVFDVGIKDKTFKNINSAQQLAALVMVQTMGPTAIKSAKVYAAASVLGVGFLPAGIVGALVGQDGGSEEFRVSSDKAYQVSLDLVKEIGELKSEDKAQGVIKGKVDGVDITIKVTKIDRRRTELTISARQLMVPKPALAKGVIYQISQKLK